MVGFQGDLARAEAEFEKALALNPNSADIQSMYSGWASGFGKPEKGAEAADRSRRLNPNTPPWAFGNYTYAYFMAGRVEEALRMQERTPRENYKRQDYVWRATLLGAVGRSDDTRAAVTEALAHYPDVNIERFARTPDWSPAEREKLTEAMRKAGFPPCATPEDLNNRPDIVRLPECVAAPAQMVSGTTKG